MQLKAFFATEPQVVRHAIDFDNQMTGTALAVTVIAPVVENAAGCCVVGDAQAVMQAIGAVAAQGENGLRQVVAEL